MGQDQCGSTGQDTPARRAGARERYRILVAAFSAYAIANISGWILPDLVNEFISIKRLSESQAGLVGTVELASLALTSMVLARFVRRTSFLTLSVGGCIIAIVGTLLSLVVEGHGALLAMRTLTGVGEGATLMVSSAALAGFPDPDRAYGQMNVFNILFGCGLILSLPLVAGHVGPSAAFPVLLGGLIILAPFLLLMPRGMALDMPHGGDGTPIEHHSLSGRTWLLAAVMFLIAISSSAVWSFLMLMGTKAGLNEAASLQLMALVAFVSVSGSLLATILGTRFGRLVPTIGGIVVMTACILALSWRSDLLLFRPAACMLVAGVYFIIPYFLGYAAVEDDSGRGAALVGGAFLLTVAIAPYIGGLLIEHFGVPAIGTFAIAANSVSIAALICFDRGQQRGGIDASVIA